METPNDNPAITEDTPSVTGCIDSYADGLISGWAFDRSGKALRLELKIGDDIIALTHQSQPREDVVALFGEQAIKAGFRALLADADCARLRDALAEALDIVVLANGVPLANASVEPDAGASDPVETNVEVSVATRGFVDRCDGFLLVGWATEGDAAAAVTLLCNGNPVRATLVREDRPDVLGADGCRVRNAGFTFDIPGAIWRDVPPRGQCVIQVRCGDAILPGLEISIGRDAIAEWVSGILELPDTPDRHHLQMLALEHLHAGGMIALLTEGDREELLAFAREQGIPAQKLMPAISVEAQAGDTLDSLLLWDVMRVLNARLAERNGQAADAVIETFRAHPMTPAAREWYANLAVQVTCETGELDRVREITDFGRFQTMALSEDATALSLAIAVLVRDGRTDLAADAMARLAGAGGWMQTVCLRHAIGDAIAGEREGRVDAQTGEELREAFLALLDSFGNDWFSRLHDVALIEATVDIVAARAQYSDLHRRKVQLQAVRLYGLCPTFWEKLAARDVIPSAGFLADAYGHWQACRQLLECFGENTSDMNAAGLAGLNYFLAAGTPDAPGVLREIVSNAVDRGFAAPDTVDLLLKYSPSDRLRVAAHPVADVDAPFTPDEPLPQCIREQSVTTSSVLGMLQRDGVASMRALRAAMQSGSHVEDALFARLVQSASLLGDARAHYLGADFLASAIGMPQVPPVQSVRLLTQVRMQLLAAIRAIKTKTKVPPPVPAESVAPPDTRDDAVAHLPAPVLAAFARLHASRNDRLVRAVADEVLLALEQQFPGISHDVLPPAGSTLDADWLADTRVFVPVRDAAEAACISRIRESWAKSLAGFGIRTQFVREDLPDDAALEPDELRAPAVAGANDVSLLRLLRWAYEQTAATYVVILPANGFLAAERFIESAAYRRHHYYGSVVTRAEITARLPADVAEPVAAFSSASLDAAAQVVDHEKGLSVSRFAMSVAFAGARSRRSLRLRANARHDGELLADLLGLGGINPSDEDFHCHFRLVSEGGASVALQQNAFMPSSDTPTVLTTAGDDADFAMVASGACGSGLFPRKIWPTPSEPRLGHNTNQLELLTPVHALARLRDAEVTVVSVMRNEMLLLPAFLAHYRQLGVSAFVIVDNVSDDGTREFLLSQPDVIVYSADTEYRHSHYGVTWQHTVLANHCLGKWVLLADADEFLVYENSEMDSLPQFIRGMEAEGASGALLRMIDMYPFDDLASADFSLENPFTAAPWYDREPLIELMFGGGQFSNSRNFVNGLRHRIAPSRINAYVSQKYALFRYLPWVRMSEGVHYTANMRVSDKPAFFAHFKYHAGFKAKVFTEVKRKQHYNGAEEYQRYAAMLAEGSGSFGDESLSVRYTGSNGFVAVAAASDAALGRRNP